MKHLSRSHSVLHSSTYTAEIHPVFRRAGGLAGWRTRGGLADGGVDGAKLKAVHTEAVEAAMRVDAALCARVAGGALVHVHARLAITLQLEASLTSALEGTEHRGRVNTQPSNAHTTYMHTFFFMLYDSVIDRKVWEREGTTCSKGPQAGVESVSL